MIALMVACANDKLRGPIVKYLNNQSDMLCVNNNILDTLIESDDGYSTKYPIEDTRILLHSIKDVKFVTILDAEAPKNDLYKLYSEAFGFKIVNFTGYENIVEIGNVIRTVIK